MKTIIHLDNLSHHAYYLVGGNSACTELVAELNKHHKIQTEGNPDFFTKKYEVFTIDDARKLKTEAEMRPVGNQASAKKIFVIQIDNITVEAQNALLKLLEEPTESTHFFFIVSAAHLLLPTVKSRMSFIESGPRTQANAATDASSKEAETFLKMSVPKRLDHVKKLVDDITKEKKTKQDAIEFLNSIQSEIYGKSGAKKASHALAVIEKARSYMNDRAPSLKMLLEYVALNI